MSSPSAHPHPLRFSSETLPPRDRIAVWREVYGQHVLRLDIEPIPDVPFHADLKLRALPGLATVSGSVGGTYGRRTRSLISDGNNDVGLVMIVEGTAMVSQFGREVTLREGEATFMSCGDAGSVFRPHLVRNIGVCVPRTTLDARIANANDAIMRPIPPHSEALRLMKSYIGVLDNNNHELTVPALRDSLVSHIHDLLACIIGDVKGDARPAVVGGLRAARLHAIKTDIDANIGRHDLTLDTVAARQNISLSYARKLLESERHHVYRAGARRAAIARAPHAERSVACRPPDQQHRARGRVRRHIVFQPHIPPAFRLCAIRDTGHQMAYRRMTMPAISLRAPR